MCVVSGGVMCVWVVGGRGVCGGGEGATEMSDGTCWGNICVCMLRRPPCSVLFPFVRRARCLLSRLLRTLGSREGRTPDMSDETCWRNN